MKKSAFSFMADSRTWVVGWCLALGAVAGSVAAGTYYVDGNIAASGNGSSWATAKKTIAEGYALTANNQENLILIRGDCQYYVGTMELSKAGLSDTQRQVYRGVPGPTTGRPPVISGATDWDEATFSPTNTHDKVYWISTGAEPVYGAWEGPLGGETGDVWTLYVNEISVDGVQTNPASWYKQGSTLYLRTVAGTSPTNVIIKTTSANSAFQIYSSFITIDGMEIRHYRTEAVRPFGAAVSYITVCNCRIHHMWDSNGGGVCSYGSSYTVAYSNTIFGNPRCSGLSSITWNSTDGTNHTYFGNTIYGCKYGITGGAGTMTVRENTCYSNTSRGIYLNPGDNHTIYNNTVYGNGAGGLLLINSTNDVVFNNTFFSNGPSGNYEMYFQNASDHAKVFNNIAWGKGTCIGVETLATNGFQSDYNDFCTIGGVNVGYWGTANKASLATWQTDTAGDAHSISADPRFAGAASGNLHLAGLSPVRDTGTAFFGGVNAPARDIDGNTRPIGPGYDMGSDESLSAGTIFTVR